MIKSRLQSGALYSEVLRIYHATFPYLYFPIKHYQCSPSMLYFIWQAYDLHVQTDEGKLARNHCLGILYHRETIYTNTMAIVSPCLFIYYLYRQVETSDGFSSSVTDKSFKVLQIHAFHTNTIYLYQSHGKINFGYNHHTMIDCVKVFDIWSIGFIN